MCVCVCVRERERGEGSWLCVVGERASELSRLSVHMSHKQTVAYHAWGLGGTEVVIICFEIQHFRDSRRKSLAICSAHILTLVCVCVCVCVCVKVLHFPV